MTEPVEARWRALLGAGQLEMREVDSHSALRMIFGVNELNQPYFFVVLASRPRAPQLSTAITVEVGQRPADSRWTLTLRLLDPALTDAFVSLMSDIAQKSALEPTEKGAWTVFVGLLTDLQHLLLPRSERLSLEALRGLIAEIWFGFDAAAHGHPLETAVMAWSGPFKGDQDFNFPVPAIQFEVKSRRPARTTVQISSTAQLDRDDVHLAVVTVEDLPMGSGGITLPGLVATTRERLDPATRSEFNRRLAVMALDLDDPWYREQAFSVPRLAVYEVTNNFPALRGSRLPSAIVRANYRLDLDQLEQYLVSDATYDAPGAAT
jgi:hypothetical protein